jgi:SpoVK/Ycf46/Vps4 family AAA+-type ATPase
MTKQDLEQLPDQVIKAVQERDYQHARRLIESLAAEAAEVERYRVLLDQQSDLNRELQQDLKQRTEDQQQPPLTRGVVLWPSPDDERNVVIGSSGQRMEVRFAGAGDLTPAALTPGWEAWLSPEKNIVKVRPPGSSGEAATVVALLDDGRLEVKGHGNEEIVVDRIRPLDAVELRSGDRVRIDPQLAVALEKLPQQETRDFELEGVPDVTYAQIGGLDTHIEEVREAIELPYLYQHLFRSYRLRRPKGILLYGPPGCGKTLIAKAIANSLTAEIRRNLEEIAQTLELLLQLRQEREADDTAAAYAAWQLRVHRPSTRTGSGAAAPALAPGEMVAELERFLSTRGIAIADAEAQLRLARRRLDDGPQAFFMSIKGPELLDKYVGETEHSIRKLFLQAKRRASTATPVIMFFDEIEALFRRRGSRLSSDVESTVVPQLLSEMDGVEELSDVIIIGATNRQDLLDPAILRPGRLDAKIKVDRPGPQAARSIFSKYLVADLPVAPEEEAGAGSRAAAVEGWIERAVERIYADSNGYRVTGAQVEGRTKTFSCREFVSGAMIESIVSRTKRRALRREIETGSQGLTWNDVEQAIREELEQNKDQLVAGALNLPEEGLTIELVMAGAAAPERASSWLQPIHRPWARQRREPRAAVA